MISKDNRIANQLRRDILKMTAAAGSGHPTSCLSCAEIVATLFFDSMSYDSKDPHNVDNDHFILSKGHAAPLLYAALKRAGCITDNLLSLRTISSNLEGHPMPRSLSWVPIATGSLGQGISVGVGIALAKKLQGRASRVFVLLGDSEIAEGSVFEALQLASHYRLNNLVAIVDVNRLGQRCETLLGHDIRSLKKRFSGFGFDIRTINGHDTSQIKKSLRPSKMPVLVLAKTIKGRGVSFLEDQNGWHGKTLSHEEFERALKEVPIQELPSIHISKPHKSSFSFKRSHLSLLKLSEEDSTRRVYGLTLANITRSDSRILSLDAETSNSTFADLVKDKTPNQFIEAFIAEQNMVGMASGLATHGFIPFVSTFAAFFSRAFDQIRMAAISGSRFVCCGSHAGVSIGPDGASQMGLEDLALFRALPNSTIFYPSDPVSTQALTIQALKNSNITYIRTSRPKTPILYKQNTQFPVGDFKVLKQSKKDKAVLIGSGITVHEARKAHEILKKKGISTAVIDLYCIKPFKHQKLHNFVRNHGNMIVLAEDHHSEGGIGEMIASKLPDQKIKFKHLSVDGIPHSGTPEELRRAHNIDAKAFVSAVLKR